MAPRGRGGRRAGKIRGPRGTLNLAALRISLRYGNGDLDWFSLLSRTDQARMLALYALDAPEPPKSGLDALAAAAKGILR